MLIDDTIKFDMKETLEPTQTQTSDQTSVGSSSVEVLTLEQEITDYFVGNLNVKLVPKEQTPSVAPKCSCNRKFVDFYNQPIGLETWTAQQQNDLNALYKQVRRLCDQSMDFKRLIVTNPEQIDNFDFDIVLESFDAFTHFAFYGLMKSR